MTRPASGFQLLAFLLLLGTSSSAVHNDATESVSTQLVHDTQDEPASEATNQARNGGRGLADAARNGPDQSQVGCRELRSTKYISDGQCTSINPIKELVCAGECLPAHLLPNWIGSGSYTGRYWSRREVQEWRCVIDRTRTQRIRLQCQDGSFRTYKITVVTSCKCKRYSRQQNDSGHKDTTVHSGKQRKNQRKAGLPEEQAGRQSDN
ncbi:sclerostin domain-containing protein 1-like [Thunnus albacares]|uniref:sclerostin domain-containing protein 1-like n=1 Tax=Thunnus maccoyii TaxID=8240 RepID=UPI001C4D1265|nr:sclerostin domain-containing protein 1-like [Thunnus maccoyii]XP_044191700.1 sclerostin domain-containing protein 1-like [Thunnus albacares]